MNCLLIAATIKEIAPFLGYLKSPENNSPGSINIDILITGIGLTATTYHLTRYFSLKKTDLVIQAGVAGCFDKKQRLGKVVVIKKDTIADESVVELEKLKTLFDMKLVPNNKAPYKKGWLVNADNILLKKTSLQPVPGISVNQITSDKKMIQFYINHFNPVIESMEGAALHYVCLMEKIPFLQIRSISNYIGERNKKNWNMKDAVANLNKELIRFIESL